MITLLRLSSGSQGSTGARGIFAFSNGALIIPIEGIILSAGVATMGLTVKVPSVTVGGIIVGALSFAMFFFLDYSAYVEALKSFLPNL